MTKFSVTTLKITFFNLARTTATPSRYISSSFAVISSSRCVMSSVSMNNTGFALSSGGGLVKTYLDLEDRKTIFRDNKGKSGI